ncbi:hypothetical protein JJE73_07710 [Comamonas sp. JC664]|nr:hypothetical protein [Comamonas sp. JC664]GHG72802.1 hypothetical protein GCM10012319_19090 [Comamonas sp. KCTC 72670]
MLILSAADPEAYATSVEMLQKKVIVPLARWLGPPDGEARAARLNILWSGLLVWLEAEIQAIVDEGGT